jgi:hypothetical protein
MYAQKIGGDSWRGEKLDKGKIDKMSGQYPFPRFRNLIQEVAYLVG